MNYSLSIAFAEMVLAQIDDSDSRAGSFQTVRFLNDGDACLYRLKFPRILRLNEREWTMSADDDAREWIAENARGAEIRDWVWVLFLSAEHQERFEKAIKLSAPHAEVWTGTGDAASLMPSRLCAPPRSSDDPLTALAVQ
ncbi:hypothetical protein M2323_003565 [Rhodoblastus acidophilus]|uniref:hypothetical protein n=1 Tax=Rhodoblastus acidophilus TaxID=1074 RepID=UPI00222491DD|nr:hypothetical protein [Rhodoblastus acidophilus]MCW2285618.1 hypothetical protein [Rhodoblastus acidophilus]MCW2334624.1 hypothetical protein [Rhodoblastus acidophilus]